MICMLIRLLATELSLDKVHGGWDLLLLLESSRVSIRLSRIGERLSRWLLITTLVSIGLSIVWDRLNRWLLVSSLVSLGHSRVGRILSRWLLVISLISLGLTRVGLRLRRALEFFHMTLAGRSSCIPYLRGRIGTRVGLVDVS